MIKLTTTVAENGKTKRVSAWLDEQTVHALEQVNDEAFTKQYIIDEHDSYLVEIKETRRHQSLYKSLDNGWDISDGHCYEDDVLRNIDNERLRQKLEMLTSGQRELIKRVYFDGESQSVIAKEMGIDKSSLRDRLRVIYKKVRKFLSV